MNQLEFILKSISFNSVEKTQCDNFLKKPTSSSLIIVFNILKDKKFKHEAAELLNWGFSNFPFCKNIVEALALFYFENSLIYECWSLLNHCRLNFKDNFSVQILLIKSCILLEKKDELYSILQLLPKEIKYNSDFIALNNYLKFKGIDSTKEELCRKHDISKNKIDKYLKNIKSKTDNLTTKFKKSIELKNITNGYQFGFNHCCLAFVFESQENSMNRHLNYDCNKVSAYEIKLLSLIKNNLNNFKKKLLIEKMLKYLK